MNLDDLDQFTDAGSLPIAPRALHELAIHHRLPFVIAAIPTDEQHVGLLVEVADGYSPAAIAIMIRDVADGLEDIGR